MHLESLVDSQTIQSNKTAVRKSQGPPPKLTSEDYSTLYQFQQMKYIDGLLTPGMGDAQSDESFLNYEKYINIMENIRERCLKLSTSFDKVTPLEVDENVRKARFEKNDKKTQQHTGLQCMKSIYENIGCSDMFQAMTEVDAFEGMQDNGNGVDEDDRFVDGSFDEMLHEFDQLDNFIFDFVPFIDIGQQRNKQGQRKIVAQSKQDLNIMTKLNELGTCFKYMYCDDVRKSSYGL